MRQTSECVNAFRLLARGKPAASASARAPVHWCSYAARKVSFLSRSALLALHPQPGFTLLMIQVIVTLLTPKLTQRSSAPRIGIVKAHQH